MKYYVLGVLAVMITLVVFAFVPIMVSAQDDLMVYGGFAVLACYFPVMWLLVKPIITFFTRTLKEDN
jgi:hypothetical protein